jgi:hypothetical protein
MNIDFSKMKYITIIAITENKSKSIWTKARISKYEDIRLKIRA